MCIVHDLSLHHTFQDILDAFEQSKMVSSLFMKRIGYLLCTCKKEIFHDSKSIIATQRSLYEWFDSSLKDLDKPQVAVERLNCFKPIVDSLKSNGSIDSGTKIAFMTLIKDLDSFNYFKLRHMTNKMDHQSRVNVGNNQHRSGVFFAKLVRLKFDLKLCSAKEFCELINKIDNCVIKYIQLTNKCTITIRDLEHLTVRHFMGEIDATIEAANEKHLYRAELALKRLADAVHYRLAKQIHKAEGDFCTAFTGKQIPSCETMVLSGSFNNVKILLQSPPHSILETPNESTIDISTVSTI